MNILTKSREKSASSLRELGKIVDIPVEQILPNPNQPRRHFDSQELASLAKRMELFSL